MIYRSALIIALSVIGTSAAHAAASTQPKGSGQVIVTAVHTKSDKGFDNEGKTTDIADYEKSEAYALVEYGVTDDLTVMITPSFSDISIDGPGGDTSGLGYTEVGARYRLAHADGAVLSVQGSARLHGKRRRDTLGQASATGSEFDARILGGTSFDLGGVPAFVDLQGGYRWRNGSSPNEFHLDATLGLRPAEPLMILAQSFTTISDGAGEAGFADYRYSNAYLSGVYDISKSWSVQAGGIFTIDGRNALRERGVLAGLWYRF